MIWCFRPISYVGHSLSWFIDFIRLSDSSFQMVTFYYALKKGAMGSDTTEEPF